MSRIWLRRRRTSLFSSRRRVNSSPAVWVWDWLVSAWELRSCSSSWEAERRAVSSAACWSFELYRRPAAMAKPTTSSQAKYFNFMMQWGFKHKADGSHKQKEKGARNRRGWLEPVAKGRLAGGAAKPQADISWTRNFLLDRVR